MADIKTDRGINFRRMQQDELDGGAFYERLAEFVRDDAEKERLRGFAKDEYHHAVTFARYSEDTRPAHPNRLRVDRLVAFARLMGYTFTIKRLEKTEDRNIEDYRSKIDAIPELGDILADEERHEQTLLGMLDEERLHYVGDIVLGMNDALVELTGSLAGYTLAMQNTHVIAMAGLITGISATLSMASSGYLSSREAGNKDAAKSSLYTGVAYLVTVALLIIPYLLLPAGAYMTALAVMLVIALLIIAGFNYYVAVAKERPFRRNFLQMAAISLSVAAISFFVGLLVKQVLHINI